MSHTWCTRSIQTSEELPGVEDGIHKFVTFCRYIICDQLREKPTMHCYIYVHVFPGRMRNSLAISVSSNC